MSMALKYAMKKRAKKMEESCEEHGEPGCGMCHGGMMAEGGEIGVTPPKVSYPGEDDEFKEDKKLEYGGLKSNGSYDYKSNSLPGSSGKKTAGVDDSVIVNETRDIVDPTRDDVLHGILKGVKDKYKDKFADGGAVDGTDGIVDRIMQRFAKGGAVANDTPPEADFEENDFDVLPDMEDTEADETGENSGDEDGDKQEDEDREDIVSRVMKSRKKKDKNPRPA